MSEAATHFGWFWWAAIAIAFISGSTPFGVMIARSRGIDILKEGSGNPGATNVGRVLGRRFGIACFLLDACKGAAPVLLSGWLAGLLGRDAGQMASPAAWGWMAVAVAAILGHCFSPFLRFRGGKGVATGFGAVLAMWPILTIPAIAAFLVWGVVLGLTRFMSLASMIGAIVLPSTVLAMAVGTGDGAVRGNIARLRRGEESSVGGTTPERQR